MTIWTDGTDIEIGQGKVIHWVDCESEKDAAYDVDYLLDPNNPFWLGLETICKNECCGLHAFDWTTDGIKIASSKCNAEEFKRTLETAIYTLERRNEHTVYFSRLSQVFDRTVFINLLQHLDMNIIQ